MRVAKKTQKQPYSVEDLFQIFSCLLAGRLVFPLCLPLRWRAQITGSASSCWIAWQNFNWQTSVRLVRHNILLHTGLCGDLSKLQRPEIRQSGIAYLLWRRFPEAMGFGVHDSQSTKLDQHQCGFDWWSIVRKATVFLQDQVVYRHCLLRPRMLRTVNGQ